MAKWLGPSADPKRAEKGDYGRDQSTRGKLAQAFLRDLLQDWREHGPSAIAAARKSQPAQYLRIVASTIPTEHLVGPSDSMAKLLEGVNEKAKALSAKAATPLSAPKVTQVKVIERPARAMTAAVEGADAPSSA